ncbi:5-(carboxyamino)imidazole ribonucleotide synthase [Alicyclobacillus cycloheptanicus]|uniref:N5-carboxyaminoimidazole ribonucleotide synthase n=1 Tax=Alicyclobacillus cycloheptanicus TaxID=1457 RepID=A0ABT9XMA8_9BACL|nr:5-(carboxyamino)imidazole ribonucleotide synthase [Alicyclobacillus cycloheptanicus]MDQ0191164.1 5-(carboxyamino)imidazole ribonucleotide synthase [Alicyclobacillus cycloheptanicus]WDM02012.1 5-(carboxyamino)imidazole ribonucleotide synthase [Alicyclobacillus cycloheptanicus]
MNWTDRIILPGQTIGVLGGGQLGRMMILEGRRMGYRFVTLDPTPDCPAGQVSDRQIVAPYTDVAAAEELAASCDVITYEFENVDAQVAQILEQRSYVPQGSRLLRVAKHRVLEKSTLAGFGIPVTPYRPVHSLDDLQVAGTTLGFPLVLKTATGGYDGKGQWRIESAAQLEKVWASAAEEVPAVGVPAAGAAGTADVAARFIAEAFIDLACELSVIAARSPKGEIRTFPVAENVHRDHILHLSIVPPRVSDALQQTAEAIARRTAHALEVVGLIAVEMFVTRDGQVLVNEIAPRPHNSGHYTYDACLTSQFEQHLRAICNLPLGDTTRWSPVVMVNILGEHLRAAVAAAPNLPPNVKLHLYGKQGAAAKRKMGHLTVLADSTEAALDQIAELGIWTTPLVSR